jgi:hypothetical protein
MHSLSCINLILPLYLLFLRPKLSLAKSPPPPTYFADKFFHLGPHPSGKTCTVHLKSYAHLLPIKEFRAESIINSILTENQNLWTMWNVNSSSTSISPEIRFYEQCTINIIVESKYGVEPKLLEHYMSSTRYDQSQLLSHSTFIFVRQSCFNVFGRPIINGVNQIFVHYDGCPWPYIKDRIMPQVFPNTMIVHSNRLPPQYWKSNYIIFLNESTKNIYNHEDRLPSELVRKILSKGEVLIYFTMNPVPVYPNCLERPQYHDVQECHSDDYYLQSLQKTLNFTVEPDSSQTVWENPDVMWAFATRIKAIQYHQKYLNSFHFRGSHSFEVLYCEVEKRKNAIAFKALWEPVRPEIWIMGAMSVTAIALVLTGAGKFDRKIINIFCRVICRLFSNLLLVYRVVFAQDISSQSTWLIRIILSFSAFILLRNYENEITSSLIAPDPPIVVNDLTELMINHNYSIFYYPTIAGRWYEEDVRLIYDAYYLPTLKIPFLRRKMEDKFRTEKAHPCIARDIRFCLHEIALNLTMKISLLTDNDEFNNDIYFRHLTALAKFKGVLCHFTKESVREQFIFSNMYNHLRLLISETTKRFESTGLFLHWEERVKVDTKHGRPYEPMPWEKARFGPEGSRTQSNTDFEETFIELVHLIPVIIICGSCFVLAVITFLVVECFEIHRENVKIWAFRLRKLKRAFVSKLKIMKYHIIQSFLDLNGRMKRLGNFRFLS